MKFPQFHNPKSCVIKVILSNPTGGLTVINLSNLGSLILSLCVSMCMLVGVLNSASLDCLDANDKRSETDGLQITAKHHAAGH